MVKNTPVQLDLVIKRLQERRKTLHEERLLAHEWSRVAIAIGGAFVALCVLVTILLRG